MDYDEVWNKEEENAEFGGINEDREKMHMRRLLQSSSAQVKIRTPKGAADQSSLRNETFDNKLKIVLGSMPPQN